MYTKLEFSHDQDGRGLKTTFSIADGADSWVTVSRDPVEYSGSGILFIAYVMTAAERKTLRNLIRANEFSANWAINTQLVVVHIILLQHKFEKNLAKNGEHRFKSFEISQYLSLRKILGISLDL